MENKKHYECMFIVSSDTTETKREELIKQFAAMAGTDAVIERWGIRKFATPINHKSHGFYVIMNFTAAPDVPDKMTKLMNITDGIVRQLFIVKNEEMLKQDVIRKQNRLHAIMAKQAELAKLENKTEAETKEEE